MRCGFCKHDGMHVQTRTLGPRPTRCARCPECAEAERLEREQLCQK